MANLPLLLQLQTIDSRIQTLNRWREETKQHPNLAALEQLMGELEKQQTSQRTQQTSERDKLRHLELDLKSGQERVRAEEKKLYGGSVNNSRELEKIQLKTAELRHHQAELEEQILGVMEIEERLTRELETCENRMEAARQEASGYRKEIENRLMEIMIEKEELEQQRQELAVQIPQDWLERYQKVAKGHHGLAIAKMKTSRCGACHVEVSESLLQKAKRGDDALIYCENCGRILFY